MVAVPGGAGADSSGPTTSVPAGASTATKILATIAGILAIVAAVTWPTGVSPVVGQWVTVASVVATGAGGVVHYIWDHSP